MAYVSKYVDRNPDIRCAGIPSNVSDSIAENFKMYSEEEAAEHILGSKCRKSLYSMRRYPYIQENELKDMLSPELSKTRFLTFREKFSEDLYFKKPELGKTHPTYSKPDDVTNENTTFGEPSHRSGTSIGELIFPKKSFEEVNREYIAAHDKYIISHNHYFPSEKINRKYDKKSFNPNAIFGQANNVDIRGVMVKKCLTDCDYLHFITRAQKENFDKTVGRLGRKIVRYKFDIPEDMIFGVTSKMDNCDVQALIENIDPCVKNTELIEALDHITKWRYILLKRQGFHIYDLKSALKELDVNDTGYHPISVLCSTARRVNIVVDECKVRIVLRYFNMIVDECLPTERVNYEDFLNLLNIRKSLPSVGKLSRMPKVVYNKSTTYRDLCNDLETKPTEAAPLKKHLYSEGVTTAADLIQPDIPMHFGLGPSDFSQPRPKHELERIFKEVLNGEFELVWDWAKEHYKPENDLMSVNQIRAAMNEA